MSTPENTVAELAFLETHGEDVSELRSELESLLQQQRQPGSPPAPSPSPAPVITEPDFRLPVNKDGDQIPLEPLASKPQQQPAPQPQPQAPVSLEQALDPLAPEAPRTPQQTDSTEETPGEVVIDAEGKLRDAKTGRYVPHQAFHEERSKRKALEQENAQSREQLARVQERLNVLNEIIQGQEMLARQQQQQQQAQPEPEEEPLIDPETDIFGAVKQMREREAKAQAKIAELERTANQRIDAIQQEARYRQDALSFASKTPDYPEAYKFFNERRREELKILGMKDERAIENQIMQEERALMVLGFKEQRSPAQIIYDMARNRGYQVKQPEPAPTLPAPVASPAPPPPAPAASQPSVPQVAADAAQAVQRIQAGTLASATLTGAGGVSGDGLTVQSLADMDDDAFSKLAAKLGGTKSLDRLLGWKG